MDGEWSELHVFGVDYDTHRVAICQLDLERDRASFHTVMYRVGKQDAFQAVRALPRMLVRQPIVSVGTGVWWVEHAFGRGPVDFQLGRVQGAILSAIDPNAPCNECPPSEWKKGIGLPGNAKKAAYLPELRERARAFVTTDADSLSEHELDAFGIALFGRTKNRAAFA